MFDLDAYLARIGYRGAHPPTLETLHALTAAHAQAIPFENLDVLLGRPIDLAPEALFDKLVRRRRGGYCFEQNGLFLLVLETLGFAVRPLSARVRLGRSRDEIPPRTHLCLRVELDGRPYLTDVGVGGLSLTSALRLDTDREQPTPHETRRIVHQDGRWFHQARLAGDWTDIYEFTGEEMPRIDREVSNWFTCTSPRSHFKTQLVAARAASGGRRLTLLNGELKVRARDGTTEIRAVTSSESLLAVLAEQFDLVFPAGTRFGPPGSPWPS